MFEKLDRFDDVSRISHICI